MLTFVFNQSRRPGVYTFNFFPPNKYAMLKNVQFAKRHGLNKVALVTNTTAQFQVYFDVAHNLLPKNNINIVLEQRYDPATTDFSPIITRIKQSGADCVMVFNVGTEGTRFYSAAAAAGLTLPLLGGYGNASADLSSVPSAFLNKYGYFITTTPFLLTTLKYSLRPLIVGAEAAANEPESGPTHATWMVAACLCVVKPAPTRMLAASTRTTTAPETTRRVRDLRCRARKRIP